MKIEMRAEVKTNDFYGVLRDLVRGYVAMYESIGYEQVKSTKGYSLKKGFSEVDIDFNLQNGVIEIRIFDSGRLVDYKKWEVKGNA